jgi:hypothetical protein
LSTAHTVSVDTGGMSLYVVENCPINFGLEESGICGWVFLYRNYQIFWVFETIILMLLGTEMPFPLIIICCYKFTEVTQKCIEVKKYVCSGHS